MPNSNLTKLELFQYQNKCTCDWFSLILGLYEYDVWVSLILGTIMHKGVWNLSLLRSCLVHGTDLKGNIIFQWIENGRFLSYDW